MDKSTSVACIFKRMNFYPNQIFHIYNQGNNRRQIFHSKENYEFFLYRLRGGLHPYGDIVSYCLMPNHFHILFFVRQVEVARSVLNESRNKAEWSRHKRKHGSKAIPIQIQNLSVSKSAELVSLNSTIGHIQKGYAKAINAENDWSGSLFRAKCKVKDGVIDDFVTTNIVEGNSKFDFTNDYARTCIRYIHDNPVKAGMVQNAEDYKWSSSPEYSGLRNGTLCNLSIGKEILGNEFG